MTTMPTIAWRSRLDFTALLGQHGRLLQLDCALPQLALVPERAVLREAVGQPFEIELDALGSSAHFELKALLGEQLSLRLLQADGRYKALHGCVFEALHLGSDGGLERYRLVMRPWLAFLAQRRDSYVFQDRDVREIAQEVFADHAGANFRFELVEPLRKRSLCIQYRESDLDFVLRLFAEEGLSFHFEHLDVADDAADGDEQGEADRLRARHVLVVTDRASARPSLGEVRFAGRHVTANLAGQRDAVTAFMAQRRLQPNAVTLGSWDYKRLAGTSAGQQTALPLGELPRLEVYDGSGAYRYADAQHAQRAASLALQALELDFERFEGQGSARHFEAGRRFTLIDHPRFGPNRTALNYAGAVTAGDMDTEHEFVLLAVEHHVANNLGAQAAQLLGSTEIERGSYRNHFHAARATTPVVPRHVRKPTAPGSQTALVVGLADAPLTTERDLRVKLQFPWQRGERPVAGGLPHTGLPDDAGRAPGDETAGTWVRVAQSAAGANWGAVFVPRIGAEVAVAFVEGDIDRPVITGGLYNGQDTPPFAAGVDSGVNHPGVIDGWHSRGLDGAGFNQWALDNATGQLRMRLHASTAAAELGLGHLIQQGAEGAQRGAWRGAGFEGVTQGWASVRTGKGLLVSTSARAGTYGSAQGTQMDAAEALAQLRAARDLGDRLSNAAAGASAAALRSHDAGQALDGFVKATDPAQDGKHAGPVNGQDARKAEGRTLTDPVEAFARPQMLLDTPSTALLATEASIAAFAGEALSLVAQGDLQHTAAHTLAAVSGTTTSWYTHEGGAKLHAANGPVSVRAHTEALQILADKEVTVVSVNDEITIAAQQRIEFVAGPSRIALEGQNIEFACPGTWSAKGSLRAFLGGGSAPASLPALPQPSLATNWIETSLRGFDGKAMSGIDYELRFRDGTTRKGTLDGSGQERQEAVPWGEASVTYQNKPSAKDLPRPTFEELLALTEPLIAAEEQAVAREQAAAQEPRAAEEEQA